MICVCAEVLSASTAAFSSAGQKSCSFCMCYSIPKWAEVCMANQKDVLLSSSVPTLKENAWWDWILLPPLTYGDSCACTTFSQSSRWPFNPSLPLLNACTTCKEITVSPAHRWLELCLQSSRRGWITVYFMKRCLLANNSLKFQHLPTSHLLSQVWGPPSPFAWEGDRREIQGFFVPTFFPLLWRCSVTEGSALLRFSAVLQYWWGSKAAQIIQGCLQEWLKSCYLCTGRTGDLRQMGLLSGTAWRACMSPWGPRQVPCLLSSEIGSFHLRKWDHVCKDLEISC